jgi:hypothetical protein
VEETMGKNAKFLDDAMDKNMEALDRAKNLKGALGRGHLTTSQERQERRNKNARKEAF